jgi:hypothetical protein
MIYKVLRLPSFLFEDRIEHCIACLLVLRWRIMRRVMKSDLTFELFSTHTYIEIPSSKCSKTVPSSLLSSCQAGSYGEHYQLPSIIPS